jgi:hypothetical protein
MAVPLVLKSLAVALPAMVLNVALSFVWVLIYSTMIEPGHDEAYYQAYAMQAAPWCSVVAGIPILFAAGWILARWHGGGWRIGIAAGIAYMVLDLGIVLAAGAIAALGAVVAISGATKLAAAALGGQSAGRTRRP